MISKIDNPTRAESKDYSNKGSGARLLNYLAGNDEKIDNDDLFFNSTRDNIGKAEVLAMIDNNVKGLRENDHKFFSMSINPSHDELQHIGNDKLKMKQFIKVCMKNYAESFTGKNLKEGDLVWAAIIHENRLFTDLDKWKFTQKNGTGQAPPFKADDRKPGNNMHIHVIVSARDRTMKQSLTALTARNKIGTKFSLKGWQKNNQVEFQRIFNYRPQVNMYFEQQQKYAEKTLNQLSAMGLDILDKEKIYKIGEGRGYDKNFTAALNHFQRDIRQNVVIDDIERYFLVGSRAYKEELQDIKRASNEDSLEMQQLINEIKQSADTASQMVLAEQEEENNLLIRKGKKGKKL